MHEPEAVRCPFCSKPLERGTWQTYCVHCYQHLPSETKAELAKPFDRGEAIATVARDHTQEISMSKRTEWMCQACGNKHNRDDRTNCWHCGAGRDGALPANPQTLGEIDRTEPASQSYAPTPPQQSYSNPLPEGVEVRTLMSRYGDAYTVARVTVGFGDVIKIIGMMLAGVIVLLTLLAAGQTEGGLSFAMFLMGLVFAAFVGVLFYLFGVMVSAQGQILEASLDGAVNSSPFLTNEHRAKIMSLR